MKFDKLFDAHVLTGVVLGIVIGLHYPTLGDHKLLLSIVGVGMVLKVVGVLK